MLKREITYETFDGDQVTEVFYFNLTKTELVELQTSVEGGMEKLLQSIVESQDTKKMLEQFKNIVLRAYGERSEDGKRFIKNEKLQEEFSQTAAYDALMSEFFTDEEALITFVRGVMPTGLGDQVAEVMKSNPALAMVQAADASAKSPVSPIPPPPPVL